MRLDFSKFYNTYFSKLYNTYVIVNIVHNMLTYFLSSILLLDIFKWTYSFTQNTIYSYISSVIIFLYTSYWQVTFPNVFLLTPQFCYINLYGSWLWCLFLVIFKSYFALIILFLIVEIIPIILNNFWIRFRFS